MTLTARDLMPSSWRIGEDQFSRGKQADTKLMEYVSWWCRFPWLSVYQLNHLQQFDHWQQLDHWHQLDPTTESLATVRSLTAAESVPTAGTLTTAEKTLIQLLNQCQQLDLWQQLKRPCSNRWISDNSLMTSSEPFPAHMNSFQR